MARSDGAYDSAEGSACVAEGGAAHAEGIRTLASGVASHAGGSDSAATRLGQLARSSGKLSVQGDAQFGQVYLMFASNDAAAHVLVIGGGAGVTFFLEPNKSYAYRYTIIARSNALGISKVWTGVGGVKVVGGVCTPIAGGAGPVSFGDVGTGAWTAAEFTNNVGGSLDLIVQDPGGGRINWVAELSWVETLL